MITCVFDQLNKVLVLIVKTKGKNDLVETKRGKNFATLNLPIDLTQDDEAQPELIAEDESEDEEDIVGQQWQRRFRKGFWRKEKI